MTDYNTYCAEAHIKPRQVVGAVSADFPKFSKIQFSMCANSAYGVCLRPEAEALLVEAFGSHPGLGCYKKPGAEKKENRKKSNMFRVRLDDDTAARVRALMQELGFTHVQDFLETALVDMLENRRKTA